MPNCQKIIGSIWLHRLEITCNLGLPDATCNTPEDHQINIFLSWNMQNIVGTFHISKFQFFLKNHIVGLPFQKLPEFHQFWAYFVPGLNPSVQVWAAVQSFHVRPNLFNNSAYLKSIRVIVSTVCPESIVWINFIKFYWMVPLIIRGSSATVKQYSMLRLIFFTGIISGRDSSTDPIFSLRIRH